VPDFLPRRRSSNIDFNLLSPKGSDVKYEILNDRFIKNKYSAISITKFVHQNSEQKETVHTKTKRRTLPHANPSFTPFSAKDVTTKTPITETTLESPVEVHRRKIRLRTRAPTQFNKPSTPDKSIAVKSPKEHIAWKGQHGKLNR